MELDNTINDFMTLTGKSKVAVVVPLYGFWDDIKNNPVNGEVLKVALSRLYSSAHQLYNIFVANPTSISQDLKNPNSIANILLSRSKHGNAVNLPVKRTTTYPEYIIEGVEYALKETDAQFIVVFNPWVMIQENGLDILIDRCNRADDAKVISGFDLRTVVEAENFDLYKANIPAEERDLSFDFLAMPRFVAEMIEIDPNYKTHSFLQRDVWQQVMQKSFEAVASQRVPIFPFNFPWNKYETKEIFDADQVYFNSKWRFDPGINFKDTRGATRRDKTGAR
jgi:hypothetical protein